MFLKFGTLGVLWSSLQRKRVWTFHLQLSPDLFQKKRRKENKNKKRVVDHGSAIKSINARCTVLKLMRVDGIATGNLLLSLQVARCC